MVRNGYCYIFKIDAPLRFKEFLVIAKTPTLAMSQAAEICAHIIKDHHLEQTAWTFSMVKELDGMIGFSIEKGDK